MSLPQNSLMFASVRPDIGHYRQRRGMVPSYGAWGVGRHFANNDSTTVQVLEWRTSRVLEALGPESLTGSRTRYFLFRRSSCTGCIDGRDHLMQAGSTIPVHTLARGLRTLPSSFRAHRCARSLFLSSLPLNVELPKHRAPSAPHPWFLLARVRAERWALCLCSVRIYAHNPGCATVLRPS